MSWPWVHPAVVHYPVAMLTVLPVIGLTWVRRDNVTHTPFSWCLVLGALGTVAAALTGPAMLELDFAANKALIERHQQLGQLVMIAAVLLTATHGGLILRHSNGVPYGRAARTGVWLVSVVLALTCAYVAHLGGTDAWPELLNKG